MVIKNVIQAGNPIIRKRSKPVKVINSAKVKKLITDLVDSMRHYSLVGMAAPQIGVNSRIFVAEIRKTKTRNPKVADQLRIFINPKIISFSKKKVWGWEGCGSVAHSDLFALVKRPAEITVVAFDGDGNKFKLKAKGLLARIVQHETDHLDGIIFLDRDINFKSLRSGRGG